MKVARKAFSLLFAVLISTSAHGEIYQGIQPNSTMTDLKALFPGATIKFVETAWATKGEALYQVTGPGLSGKMMIKFSDTSAFFKDYISEHPDQETSDALRELSVSSDNSMSVDWVRYVPESYIPIERLISKYGQPEKSGFAEVDFSPYKSWESKGVFASLTDNAKFVLFIDYTFTTKERCDVLKQRNDWVPDYCKKKPDAGAPSKKMTTK